ncbi:MAG: hypothetical protein CVU05_03935 [Bacteroidetes bacterium HGW-Bacteroidetes-21]|jgi:hypothetical protein|nr:MAG: hypothetical protein CVU05_03935 [Bacteroidetes bacterium HGW-Bacteroidetes-21]
MTTIKVTIADSVLAEKLVKFLKTISYVKDVSIEKTITGADWIKSGRTATEKEVNLMLEEMENDKTEFTTEQVRADLKKWQKRK